MHVLSIKSRKEICEACPIFNPLNGLCNPKLWLNPETNEVSNTKKEGFVRGCGCLVYIKMKNLANHCVAQKW